MVHFIFWWPKITVDSACSREFKTHSLLGRKVMTNLDSILRSRDIANKGPSSQGYGFSSSHVWMWELDCEESWVPKNWWLWTVVLEKTLEGPLDCKEIQPVHPKGDQSWVFIWRTDAEAEAPILWPPHAKSWLVGKDPYAGRDGVRKRRGWRRLGLLDGIINWMDMGESKVRDLVMYREAWCAAIHGVTKSWTRMSGWTELNWIIRMLGIFSCAYEPSVCLLWRNVCLDFLPTFWLGCLFLWYWAVWAACIILEINPLSVPSFTIIFSQTEACLFILLIVFFTVQ